MNIIEVTDLTKKYRNSNVNAVDGISFFVREGEFFAFLGPNGAGKTTTISILTTTLSKTSGTIKITGLDLDKQPSDIRANIGVIFQNPSLDANLTAEENIRLHVNLYKMYPFRPTYNLMPQLYKDKVTELSAVLGLKEDIFKPIKTFSGGMKRKLEILRTLMHSPKVLFLDEPTSGLDPLSRRNLWEYLQDIKSRENTTIFLTTHYLEEAEKADRVCIINHGKVVITDTINNVKSRLLKDTVYVESENNNQLMKELAQGGFQSSRSGMGVTVHAQSSDVQKMLKFVRTGITRMNINEPSLEDAYLDLVKETNE